MPTSTYVPSPRELQLASDLQQLCITEINLRDVDEVCAQVSLAPEGLQRLLWQSSWDLTTAIRIADGLELEALDRLLACVEVVAPRDHRQAS